MPGAGSDRSRWVSCAGGAFVGWVRGLSGDGREGFTRGRGRRSGGRAPVIRKRRGQIRVLFFFDADSGRGGVPRPGSGHATRPDPSSGDVSPEYFVDVREAGLTLMMRRGSALEAEAISACFRRFDDPSSFASRAVPCVVCRLPRTRRGTRTRARGLKNLCAGRSRECSLAGVPPVARSVRPATVRITAGSRLVRFEPPRYGPLEPPRYGRITGTKAIE